MRIQKYLSEQKLCSRREAERYIAAGLVKVNGKVVTNLATQIDPAIDRVELNIASAEQAEKVTLAVYKPRGYVSSHLRREGKPIFELLPKEFAKLNAVGRLDKESEGLILLSNDGSITAAVTGDDHILEKEYEVIVRERVTQSKLDKMSEGINLEDGMTMPAKTKSLGDNGFRIILKEGRKHQIRRMCEAMHLTVTSLKRIRIDSITLSAIKPGSYRRLSADEISMLKKKTISS